MYSSVALNPFHPFQVCFPFSYIYMTVCPVFLVSGGHIYCKLQVKQGMLCRRSDFARQQSGIFVSPMLVESGSEIGLALRIHYMPAMGIISSWIFVSDSFPLRRATRSHDLCRYPTRSSRTLSRSKHLVNVHLRLTKHTVHSRPLCEHQIGVILLLRLHDRDETRFASHGRPCAQTYP